MTSVCNWPQPAGSWKVTLTRASGGGASEWEALRGVIACNVPAPIGIGPSEAPLPRRRKRGSISRSGSRRRGTESYKWPANCGCCGRRGRQRKWHGEKRWRVVGRGILRVLLRAWREVSDGVPAGAAVWDGRWNAATQHDCLLARRLVFSDGCDVTWWTDGGWQVQMLLTWQRLVRAGVVRAARRRSSRWRASDLVTPCSSSGPATRQAPAPDSPGGGGRRG